MRKRLQFESYLDQHYDGVTAKVFLDAYRHYNDLPCSNDRAPNRHYDGLPCSNDRDANWHYDGIPCSNDRDANWHHDGLSRERTATRADITTTCHAQIDLNATRHTSALHVHGDIN